jgi:hypothetical protein
MVDDVREGPGEGRDEARADLAARCADWLTAERDRIEREVRAEYERRHDGDDPGGARHRVRPAQPPAAAPLIGLLDRLAELTVAPGSPTDTRRDPILDWVRRSVLTALAASGVTPVEDSGPVDPARHNVVATRDDLSGLRCGAIAETVRPGYLWGEALLRHQEVVAYVPPRKPGAVPAPRKEGGTP